MDASERELIDGLFQRMKTLEVQNKDLDAENFIHGAMRDNPHSPYLLVQTTLVQQQALEAAQQRIEGLEKELEARKQNAPQTGATRTSGLSSSGFVGTGAQARQSGGFANAHESAPAATARPADVPPWQAAPTAPANAASQPQPTAVPASRVAQREDGAGAAGGAGAQRGQSALTPNTQMPNTQKPQNQRRGSGGGFMQQAAATAAGVAGGMMLGNMLTGLLGGGTSSGTSSGAGATETAAATPSASDGSATSTPVTETVSDTGATPDSTAAGDAIPTADQSAEAQPANPWGTSNENQSISEAESLTDDTGNMGDMGQDQGYSDQGYSQATSDTSSGEDYWYNDDDGGWDDSGDFGGGDMEF